VVRQRSEATVGSGQESHHNPANERILSHISIWEILTKVASAKLDDRWTPDEIEHQCSLLEIDLLLPIELKHI
jgi:PIN domain nuclease of toxin-antitoxin system